MKVILASAITLITTTVMAAPFPSASATIPYQETKTTKQCNSSGCLIKFPKVKTRTTLQHVSCGYVIPNAGTSSIAILALSGGSLQYLLPATTGAIDASGNLDYIINTDVLLFEDKDDTAEITVATEGGTSPGVLCEISGYSS